MEKWKEELKNPYLLAIALMGYLVISLIFDLPGGYAAGFLSALLMIHADENIYDSECKCCKD